jgi:branched-chain amino acid transport system substrate-binding protein
MIKFVLLFLTILFFTSCQENNKEEIKIGFIAGLTGKYSSLGSDIRDGFILGFDEINYTINGKRVKIIQKDDKQDPKIAKKIIHDFIKKDIKLIVGNATSSMTKITLNELKGKDDFLVASVTASASEFTKKDDNFIRIQVEHNEKRYNALKKYIIQNNIKKVFYIYDDKNLNYAKGYFGFFQSILKENGGYNFVGTKIISNGYKEIVKSLKNSDFDMILIVANSSDTANLIQYLRINNIKEQISISGWANTNDFVEFGGKAIEGVIVSTGYNKQSKDKRYLEFVKNFNKKYNNSPSVFSLQGYEMSQILIENLKKTSNISELKHYILEGKIYKGLQGFIEFDKYGDVNRDYFIMKMKNGKFEKIVE